MLTICIALSNRRTRIKSRCVRANLAIAASLESSVALRTSATTASNAKEFLTVAMPRKRRKSAWLLPQAHAKGIFRGIAQTKAKIRAGCGLVARPCLNNGRRRKNVIRVMLITILVALGTVLIVCTWVRVTNAVRWGALANVSHPSSEALELRAARLVLCCLIQV